MRLATALGLNSSGTSEGATKGWDSRGRGRHILEHPPTLHVPLGKTTEDILKDSSTGKWDRNPAVAEWHQAFADKQIEGKVPVAGRKPIAIVLGGGTASGKTTLARSLGADNPNMVHVDADGIKPQTLAFNELRSQEGDQSKQTDERNPNLAASRVHEESSYLAKLVMAKAAANQLDMIYDATSSGQGGSTLNGFVNKLQSEGYDIHGIWADVPIETAVQRAEQRAADPSDPAGFGRHIPTSAMRSTHIGSAQNFMIMKDHPAFQTMRLFDTSGKLGDQPKMVYSREGTGEGKVHDQEKWDYYQAKSHEQY